ncbi:MAG TPA: hypothetical protein VIK56_04330 [Rhodoferax sp.]
MQLDIFEHSRDVMLKNDVVQALERRDIAAALQTRAVLAQEYPDAAGLPDLDQMISAIQKPAVRINTHDELAHTRLWLSTSVEPAAQRVLGQRAGQVWVVPIWKNLATGAAALPWRAQSPMDHSAALWLHIADWAAAIMAVKTIESWRRKPAPLSWMLHANLALTGLQANLGMLAELAWISPSRLEGVVTAVRDPLLTQLVRKFEVQFEGYENSDDLAWLGAWALTDQPNFAAAFALAQPSNHSAPERGMRLMIELLGLERQGRHHDIVIQRKDLKDLNGALFAAYMKSR